MAKDEVKVTSSIKNAEWTKGEYKFQFQIQPIGAVHGGSIRRGEQHVGDFSIDKDRIGLNVTRGQDFMRVSELVNELSSKLTEGDSPTQ